MIRIYIRVSDRSQDHRSQKPDLKKWADQQDEPVSRYHDTATGKTSLRGRVTASKESWIDHPSEEEARN